MAGNRNRNHRRGKTRSPIAHNGLSAYLSPFLEWCAAKGLSPRTLEGRDIAIHRFIVWCDERAIDHPSTITLPILERYQKHLYYYRKPNGEPLGYSSQHALLTPLKAWFKWLVRERHILFNPASELELPRVPKGLPRVVLSVEEVEQVLTTPDTDDPSGIRDRAMLELFYGTGIRRMEMVNLSLYDLNPSRKTLLVREGKGRKDRLLPVGERALHWAERYRQEVRPELVSGKDSGHLFLTDQGQPWPMGYLTALVRKYLRQSGLKKQGACHLFRHAMATHMLDNGADIRYIQTMLGHAELSTTQIYTQVSIEKLREVHRATHPAKWEDERAALLETLDSELEADDD